MPRSDGSDEISPSSSATAPRPDPPGGSGPRLRLERLRRGRLEADRRAERGAPCSSSEGGGHRGAGNALLVLVAGGARNVEAECAGKVEGPEPAEVLGDRRARNEVELGSRRAERPEPHV